MPMRIKDLVQYYWNNNDTELNLSHKLVYSEKEYNKLKKELEEIKVRQIKHIRFIYM